MKIKQFLEKIIKHYRSDALGAVVATLVFCLPFERIPSLQIVLFGSSITIRLSQVAGLVLLGLIASKHRDKWRQLKHPEYYLLAGFVTTMMVSASQAQDLKRAVLVLAFTIFTIAVGVGVSLCLDDKRLALAERALQATTFVVIAFGFYQYFGDIIGLPASMTGLSPNYVKAVFGFPRIQSTGLEPLYFANFLLIPFFVFSARFLLDVPRRSHDWLIGLCAVILVMTVSRGAIIGGVLGLIVLLGALWWRRALIRHRLVRYLGIVLLGAVVAIGLTMLPSLIVREKGDSVGSKKAERLIEQTTNLRAQDDRTINIEIAKKAFATAPIFGVGPGNFDHFARDNGVPYETKSGHYIIVNNEFYELLAETGLVGVGLLGLFCVLIVWKLLRELVLAKQTDKKLDVRSWWGVALLAYFVATAVQYQTFSTLYIMHIWVAIGIALALTVQSNGKTQPARKKTA